MAQRLNGKLECATCLTIYLRIPRNVDSDSPIFCMGCGTFLGRWFDLETDFIAQGGHDGIFELREGQIIRRE